MSRPSVHEQLRLAFDASGLSSWELSRRANVKTALVVEAMSGGGNVRVETLIRLARALGFELALAPLEPEALRFGPVPTVVQHALMKLSPARDVHAAADTTPNILALDLEGTLISNAVSVFVRPGLHRFLTLCRPLFKRVVMFTTVNEARFREIAAFLVEEGSAPSWFANLEYINWKGPTKNLTAIPDAEVSRVLLVDDIERYVHPGQESQWVPIKGFEPPFVQDDAELERVLEELVRRISDRARSTRT